MEDLKQSLEVAFNIADQYQQAGNATMSLVKLELKKTAGYFSPELAASFAARLGVGSANPLGGRPSFAWKGEMPGKGRGGKKSTVAVRVAPEVKEVQPKSGIVTEETETGLYQKLAAMSPTNIAAEYGETLATLAAGLGIEVQEGWNEKQTAAAIRKAAKEKIAE